MNYFVAASGGHCGSVTNQQHERTVKENTVEINEKSKLQQLPKITQ